jgi:hypothetical protein
MKTSSSGFQHLTGDVTTLALKITRGDGVVLGFTDHVRDLDVESVFVDDGITEEDLRTGLDARVRLPRSKP